MVADIKLLATKGNIFVLLLFNKRTNTEIVLKNLLNKTLILVPYSPIVIEIVCQNTPNVL